MKSQFVSITSLLVCVLSFWPSLAQANLVPIAITGEVTSVIDRGPLEERVNIGDLITGVYIYDLSTSDTFPTDPVYGHYHHQAPPCGIFLTIGGFVFMTDPDNINFTVSIVNDPPEHAGGSYDSYQISSLNNLPLSNGSEVESIVLGAFGSVDILSSDELPTTAPDLNADWRDGKVNIIISVVRRSSIQGYVTSAAVIPEPATIIMLGLGGLALLGIRCKYSRNAKNKIDSHDPSI